MKEAIVALDIGGTYIKGALLSKEGDFLYKQSFETIPSLTKEEHKDHMINMLKVLIENLPSDYKLIGFASGSPGMADKDTLHIGGAENIPGLYGLKFSDVGDFFNIPSRHENDANLATLGEFVYGDKENKNYNGIMAVTLGTGIGGGFILDGRLYTGSHGGAGEIGHVCVVPNGLNCNCGSRGCIEQYASASGFVNLAKQKIHKGIKNTELTFDILEKGKAKIIFDYAKKGDELALDVIRECGYYLGISISQAINFFDLDLILIGGGLCKDFDMLIPHIKSAIYDYTLRISARDVEIKSASLGNDAGLLGCVALFFYGES